ANRLAHGLAAILQVNLHQPELHDLLRLLQGEQYLSRVGIALLMLRKHLHIDEIAVMSFHRHGHVMLMNEQSAVRLRNFTWGNEVEAFEVIRGREKSKQVGQVWAGLRGRIHTPSCTKAGSASVEQGWR